MKVEVKVVYRIEGGNVETHPAGDVSYTVTSRKQRGANLRFSGGTLRSSKILAPISFMVVTTEGFMRGEYNADLL